MSLQAQGGRYAFAYQIDDAGVGLFLFDEMASGDVTLLGDMELTFSGEELKEPVQMAIDDLVLAALIHVDETLWLGVGQVSAPSTWSLSNLSAALGFVPSPDFSAYIIGLDGETVVFSVGESLFYLDVGTTEVLHIIDLPGVTTSAASAGGPLMVTTHDSLIKIQPPCPGP